MDEDGLPLMGSGIDLTKVPAIQQKRTVAFLNQFVVHTVQFLNRFSTVCEEKLSALSLRIQQIETTLNILDAKLSSIPGLEDVKFEISTANVNSVTNGPEATPDQQSSLSPQSENNTQDSGPQKCEAAAEHILTVAKDPRYARYLKMVQVLSLVDILKEEVDLEISIPLSLLHHWGDGSVSHKENASIAYFNPPVKVTDPVSKGIKFTMAYQLCLQKYL
ncbi:WASH complex subunit 3 isoform X2 [Monodelphis domestica]|uniref:WASH complex subunit 3 isoform X2 n=1 Tax=Monodelphis domestica TaxID=13616 RepID=UPI0024E1B6ED|nr:WASH complex subunit 3 isoform X2 [Monodelphis domestica]